MPLGPVPLLMIIGFVNRGFKYMALNFLITKKEMTAICSFCLFIHIIRSIYKVKINHFLKGNTALFITET